MGQWLENYNEVLILDMLKKWHCPSPTIYTHQALGSRCLDSTKKA